MTEPLVMWINPRCSTCRRALAIAEEAGARVVQRRYLDDPPTAGELREVLRLAGADDPRAIARRKEPRWAELGLDGAPAERVIEAMAAEPRLIERPVVIRGGRALVARPPERVLELLDG